MKFSYKGKWTFDARGTVSDKIKKAIFNLLGKSEPTSIPNVFGEAIANSEINWEVSAEMNVEDFLAIQKEARENDNHILEWLQNYGKSLVSGAGQVLAEAKKDVPEWQKIFHEYNIQEIKNNHEETIMRAKLRKEERAAEKEADKEE